MRNTLVILFGAPGVGKTTTALAMKKQGYFYYEGDDDILPESRARNSRGLPLTAELRVRQNGFIIQRIASLSVTHPKMVVAYNFMWDRWRRRMMEVCPWAQWFLLVAPRKILEKRVDRPEHLISSKFAMQIFDKFEVPTTPHKVIMTDKSIDEVVREICKAV
jgi:gluconate kinase